MQPIKKPIPLQPEIVFKLIDLGYEKENEIEELCIFKPWLDIKKSFTISAESPKVLEYIEMGFEVIPFITTSQVLRWLGVKERNLRAEYNKYPMRKLNYWVWRWLFLKAILFTGQHLSHVHQKFIPMLEKKIPEENNP